MTISEIKPKDLEGHTHIANSNALADGWAIS